MSPSVSLESDEDIQYEEARTVNEDIIILYDSKNFA